MIRHFSRESAAAVNYSPKDDQNTTPSVPQAVAALAGLSLLMLCGCSNSRANSSAAAVSGPVPAHIYTVAEETTRRRVQAVGSLYPLEESTLSAEVEARVSKVLADVGDTVKEGQPLILLDERELQFEVERQQGLVRQVRAQLGIGPKDPAPRDARQLASVQKAEADRFDAQRKYTRAQTMFKDNLISQQQFDEAASRYQSTQASYDLALQEVERLKALLITNEASEQLAEKKLADATIRRPTPVPSSHATCIRANTSKCRAPSWCSSGPIACGRGSQCPSDGRAG